MLAFSKSLPIFAISLTTIYSIILLVDKEQIKESKSKLINKALLTISLLALFLSLIGAILTLCIDFRESVPYFIIIIMVGIVICVSSSHAEIPRIGRLLLPTTILWYTMMVWDTKPLIDIAIGEGQEMTRYMSLNKRWDFLAAKSPVYNPLPCTSSILDILSEITFIPWYSWSVQFIFYSVLIIAYVLLIFNLTKKITYSYQAGLLATLLIGLTPQTNVLMHSYQWTGNLLIIISTLMIIKVTEGQRKAEGLLCASLSYVTAILAHPTAGLMVFILLITILLKHFLSLHDLRQGRFIDTSKLTFERSVMRTFVIFVAVITLARAVHTAGYMEYILPMLVDFFHEMFLLGETKQRTFTPLYDRSGVDFKQAYPWSLAIAMATALIIVEMARRRIKFWHLVLYGASISFIFTSYIIGALFKEVASTAMYRGAYVAVPLLFPLAALALAKSLSSRRKGVMVMALITVAIAILIAAHDPNISPREYARIRKFEPARVTPPTYEPLYLNPAYMVKANTLLTHLQLPSRFIIKSEMLQVGTGGELGRWEPMLTNKLMIAIKVKMFINGYEIPDLELLQGTENYFAFNKLYDSGRDSVFSSSP
jgi:hypothetical protein